MQKNWRLTSKLHARTPGMSCTTLTFSVFTMCKEFKTNMFQSAFNSPYSDLSIASDSFCWMILTLN